MACWLFKSEPDTFSIDDLMKRPSQTEPWDGVRNYQARNFLRNQVKLGDSVLFYHSSCKEPGIVGMAKVVKAGYPDSTQFDPSSKYFDPKSTPEKPIWYRVDVKFSRKLSRTLSLNEIKQHPLLCQMQVARRGNRLSITPVTQAEWEAILGHA